MVPVVAPVVEGVILWNRGVRVPVAPAEKLVDALESDRLVRAL